MKVKAHQLWSRDFIILMFACSGISFCNYFFTSTLPIYAQNMTGTTIYAGLMLTVFTFAALLTRPLTGILSDRIGRVKLLILGAGLCAVSCILYHFSSGIVVLIIVRALQGIGFGIHTTSGGAVAADIIPKSRMSEGLGIFGLYGTIASALAPAIALSIIGSGENEKFRSLFTLASVIAVICIALDSLIRYERRKEKEPNSTPAEKDDASGGVAAPQPKTYLGFEKGVFLPAAFMFLFFVAFSSVTSFLTLFARERHLGDIGLFFTINAAGMFCSRLFLGKTADRRGADIVVIPALIALIPCFALIPFINLRILLFIVALPMGLAQGAICPVVNMMMFRRCSANRLGSASAAYFASIDLGFGGGALLFGYVAEYLGFKFVYWGAVLFAVLALLIYMLFLRSKKAVNKGDIIKAT